MDIITVVVMIFLVVKIMFAAEVTVLFLELGTRTDVTILKKLSTNQRY